MKRIHKVKKNGEEVLIRTSTSAVFTPQGQTIQAWVNEKYDDHVNDGVAHVTQADRDKWNNAAAYDDTAVKADIADLKTHAADNVRHITATERNRWNDKVDTATLDARLAGLVDSAPGALDTLNELAAALGDDPNFATTVTNKLAEKVDREDLTNLDLINDRALEYINLVDLPGHRYTVSSFRQYLTVDFPTLAKLPRGVDLYFSYDIVLDDPSSTPHTQIAFTIDGANQFYTIANGTPFRLPADGDIQACFVYSNLSTLAGTSSNLMIAHYPNVDYRPYREELTNTSLINDVVLEHANLLNVSAFYQKDNVTVNGEEVTFTTTGNEDHPLRTIYPQFLDAGNNVVGFGPSVNSGSHIVPAGATKILIGLNGLTGNGIRYYLSDMGLEPGDKYYLTAKQTYQSSNNNIHWFKDLMISKYTDIEYQPYVDKNTALKSEITTVKNDLTSVQNRVTVLENTGGVVGTMKTWGTVLGYNGPTCTVWWNTTTNLATLYIHAYEGGDMNIGTWDLPFSITGARYCPLVFLDNNNVGVETLAPSKPVTWSGNQVTVNQSKAVTKSDWYISATFFGPISE